jgi:hypothetical protein
VNERAAPDGATGCCALTSEPRLPAPTALLLSMRSSSLGATRRSAQDCRFRTKGQSRTGPGTACPIIFGARPERPRRARRSPNPGLASRRPEPRAAYAESVRPLWLEASPSSSRSLVPAIGMSPLRLPGPPRRENKSSRAGSRPHTLGSGATAQAPRRRQWSGSASGKRARGRSRIRPSKQASGCWSQTRSSPQAGHARRRARRRLPM